MRQLIKLLIILFFILFNFLFAQASDLSNDEIDYLKNKRTLTIAINDNWKPYSFYENGKPNGVLYDFAKLVSNKLGLELQIIKMNYDNAYNSLQNNKIDLMFEAIESMKTDTTLLSSQSFFPFIDGIISKNGYTKIESLKDKIIALDITSKNYFINFYDLNEKNIVIYKNDKELIQLLLNDKVDAAINDFQKFNYLINENDLNKIILVKSIENNKNFTKTFTLFSKQNEKLRNIFDKLIDKNDYDFVSSSWETKLKNQSTLDFFKQLSFDEKKYLKENPILKIGYSLTFEPLLLKNELGKIDGLFYDYYELIAKKLGVKIEYKIDTWDNVLEDLTSGKIDVIPGISKTLASNKGYLTADPLLSIYLEVFTNKNSEKNIESFENLKGLKVAYNKNIKVLDNFMQKYKDTITILPTDDSLDSLKLLQDKKIDACIEFNRAKYLMTKYDLIDIKPTFSLNEVKIDAVTAIKDNPILQSIIQKVISSFSISETKAISQKWLGENDSLNKNDLINLTAKEKDYIANKKILKVHTEPSWYPFSYLDTKNNPNGYMYDLKKLIEKRTGLKLEVSTKSYKEAIQETINNKLDLMVDMPKTDDVENKLLFSKNSTYYYTEGIISTKDYKQLSELNGKKVGYISGIEYYANKYPNTQFIAYKDDKELIKSVINGNIDAAIDSYVTLQYFLQDMSLGIKLKLNLITENQEVYYHIATAKENQTLFNILEKVITKDDINDLKEKWGLIHNNYNYTKLSYLSKEELDYIKEKQYITISNEFDYEPIDYSINNIPIGYSIDLIELLLKDTGLKIKYKTDSWTNLFQEFKNGKIDLIHTLYKNEEREKFINFSDGYLIGRSQGIVQIKDSQDMKTIKDLYGKKVGVTQEWYLESEMKKHPQIQLVYLKNIEEKLDALYHNKIDAFIDDKNIANYYINKYGYADNFKVLNLVDKDINKNTIAFHFGTLKDEPHLISIINKLLKNLSPIEQNKLIEKWFGNLNGDIKVTENNSSNYLLLASIAILIIILFYADSRKKASYLKEEKELFKIILNEKNESDSKNINIFKSSFKKYIYSLFMLAIFIISSFLIFEYFMKKNELLGTILNKAGKQRLLSQKLIMESQKNANNELLYKKLIITMHNDHEWIIDNLTTKKELDFYLKNEIDKKIHDYIGLNEKMLNYPSKELFKQIENDGYLLLDELEKVVLVHEQTYKDSIELFQYLKLLETILALLFLYFLWIYIYKPNSIRQETLYDAISYEKEKILEITKEQKHLLSLFNKGDAILFKWKNNSTWDVEYVSNNVENFFGYSKEEFLNQTVLYEKCIYQDDSKRVQEEVLSAIVENKDFFRHQPYRIISKNGDIKWILDISVTQKNDSGNIEYFIGYILDITNDIELKIELEEKTHDLEKLNETLQNKNEKLATSEKELIENQHQIEILMQAKEQFLANMSHEIRTPLNGIVGIIDMLIDEIGENKSLMYKINTLKKSSNILTNIVNDILDYSSLQTGNVQLYPKEFSFREMLKYIENTLRNEIESKNLEFDIFIDEEIEDMLIGDEIRFSQILLNLLNNAKKFTKEGKVSLIVKTITTNEKNVSLIIEVKDSGIGMSQEIQQNLFKPFTQGNQSNTKEFKGTGLGLSIVKSLVNIMGGTIDVYSKEGVGTTFIINLDLPYSKKKLVSTNKNEIIVLPEIKKALLVEDDEINQYVIKAALIKRNFEVDILENGLEALNILNKNHSYDIVFMDVQMPIMDGIEATKEIRKFNTQIPIIALSAAVLPENVQESFDAGMNMHISKPIVNEEINKILNRFFTTGSKEE